MRVAGAVVLVASLAVATMVAVVLVAPRVWHWPALCLVLAGAAYLVCRLCSPPRCHGYTRDGGRCRRGQYEGGRYCYTHSGAAKRVEGM